MSRSEAKRRKVWVNEYSEGRQGSSAFPTKHTAKCAGVNFDGNPVLYIERLPGDVVRTKNEEVALESAIDRYTEAWETAYATHTDEARRAVTACGRNLRALLRGRR